MKNLAKILGTALLLILLSVSLAACGLSIGGGSGGGSGGDVAEHNHNYEEWEITDTEHWLPCTFPGCDKRIDLGEHSFTEWEELAPMTCQQNGHYERECAVCGKLETNIVYSDPDAHTSTEPIVFDESYHWYVCTNNDSCSAHFEKSEHVWGADGKCTKCPKSEEIPFLEFTVYDDHAELFNCEMGAGSVVIPTVYDGLPVTAICDGAFMGVTTLQSVVIPEGITYIGSEAFDGCWELTEITIPASVTYIGEKVLPYCLKLESIEVSPLNEAYKAKDGVLYTKDGSGLVAYPIGKTDESFTIPNSVTTIWPKAFSYSRNLTEVIIPEGVTEIGEYAFFTAKYLDRIDIPASVTKIKTGAFSHCSSVTEVSFAMDGALESIGEIAFYDCGFVKEITIPKSVRQIGSQAFTHSLYLENIFVDKENTVFLSIDGNLYKEGGRVLVAYATGKDATSFAVPTDVTKIGEYAFAFSDLENIELPVGILRIEKYAFWESSLLKSMHIPDKVTVIEKGAFESCGNLESVTFSDSCEIEAISENTFRYCYKLAAIAIPDSVTSICDSAFERCYLLTSVTFTDNSRLNAIGKNAFESCAFTEFNIPDGVASIGERAFMNCGNLISIDIPGINKIEDATFSGCIALKHVTIPATAVRIGRYAFEYTAIESIIIPSSVYVIDDCAFMGCEALKEITVPHSLSVIEDEVFKDCTSLTSVTLYASIDSINYGAFEGCSALATIYYTGTLEDWKEIDKLPGWNDNTGEYTIVYEYGK